MPGRLMSYENFARPATLSGPSSRFTDVPITAGLSGHKYLSGAFGGGVWLPRPCILGTGHPPYLHVRFENAREGPAPADVAVEPLLDLLDGRLRMLLEERDRRHDEPRCAEAAHQPVGVAERLLHGMQRGASREAFHGPNLFALHFDRKRRARIHRAAVHDHRAGAAGAAIAHALVAGHVGTRTDRIEQRHARFDLEIQPLAVHEQLDRHFAGSDRARAWRLRVGGRDADDGGREAADAGRLQERAAAD